MAFTLVAERQRAHEPVEQLLAIAQEEEQEVQHQEEEHERAHRVLTDRERARSNEPASLYRRARDLRLDTGCIHAEPREQSPELRNTFDGVRVQLLKTELAATELGIERRR